MLTVVRNRGRNKLWLAVSERAAEMKHRALDRVRLAFFFHLLNSPANDWDWGSGDRDSQRPPCVGGFVWREIESARGNPLVDLALYT